MKLADIYYRYWMITGEWSWELRALVSIFAAVFLLFLILKVTYRLWRPILLNLEMVLIRAYAALICELFYHTGMEKTQGAAYTGFCEKYNCFIGKKEERANRIQALKERSKKQGFRLKWLLVLYGIAVVGIFGPVFLEIPAGKPWAFVLSKYRNIEEDGLAGAASYLPETSPEEQAETAGAIIEEEAPIKYRLNGKGRNGSNLRKGPGKNSKVVKVLKGDVVMEQADPPDEKETAWVNVRLEDGTEGWISRNLIEETEQ